MNLTIGYYTKGTLNFKQKLYFHRSLQYQIRIRGLKLTNLLIFNLNNCRQSKKNYNQFFMTGSV